MRDYWLSKLFFDLQSPALAEEYRGRRAEVLDRYPLKPEVRAAVESDDVAYLEIIAQSMAALEAYAALGSEGGVFGGFLVGAEDLEVLGTARVGDRLHVLVRKDTRIGKYGIVSGTILRDDSALARGQIKIWREAGAPAD